MLLVRQGEVGTMTGGDDFYAMPFELGLNRKLKRYVSVSKPKVDAKQLEPAVGANCP